MSLILAVDQACRMMKNLSNVLIVKHVYLLVISKGVVQDIHYDSSIIHHAKSV